MWVSEQFPAGLRVLVVDDDVTCLKILEQQLRRCMYCVTSCPRATDALNLLRENKGCFDMVLSDVHMPDMDGFKLLEHVGLEMDLPVIMMSADGRTSAVMQGIRHGACDYLIKPIREEELKNLWQHVLRKQCIGNKEHEQQSCSLDDVEQPKRGGGDTDYASSFNSEGAEGLSKTQKKRRDDKEEDFDNENDDPTAAKKPRVVWSVELHQQFVSAVNHLGIDKAVPKRILELMNVPGLTRENVASHLQKFRLYLKRLSGVSQHQGGISSPYCGSVEPNVKLGSFGGFDSGYIQTLAASGQVPPQMLAVLNAELLGRPIGGLLLTGMDQSLPGSLQGHKPIPRDHVMSYDQPLIRCSSNIPKQFPQNIIAAEEVRSGQGSWVPSGLTGVGPNNIGSLVDQNGNGFVGMFNNQQQKHLTVSEPTCSINVQPSCLVVPSQASPSFHCGQNSASVDQNFNFNGKPPINYNFNSSDFGIAHVMDGASSSNKRSVVSGYSVHRSIDSTVSSCSINPDRCVDGVARQLQQAVTPNVGSIQDTISTRVEQSLNQGPLRSLGFVGKGTSIPSRFAVDETELPINNVNHVTAYADNGRRVKQETNVDFVERERVGIPVLQNYSTNDLMHAISE